MLCFPGFGCPKRTISRQKRFEKRKISCKVHFTWKAANGGQNVSCDFGGGKRTIERPSKTTFGGLRTWDLSGLCPFPPKTMTWSEQTGGSSERIIGGGVQNCFWGGVLWYVFPYPEFSTPFVFSDLPSAKSKENRTKQKSKEIPKKARKGGSGLGEKKTIFIYVRAIRANHLKPAIRKF